jgi:hypothetical protein
MVENERFAASLAELERAAEVVAELHAGCCEPLRSPRMETLVATLRRAFGSLGELDDDSDAAGRVVALLEDAGAQLGYLQVACCTPARTKLYGEALDRLGKTQRLIKRTLDLDH